MIILGIDPGRNGALAIFDKNERSVRCIDMPDTTAALHALLSDLPQIAFAVLEKPFYPHTIGITNAVKIAEAFGTLKGALAWLDIAAYEVRPHEWKAALNLTSSKSASREKAGQIFPDGADQWARVKDDGRAEAALLAWYGLRWAS